MLPVVVGHGRVAVKPAKPGTMRGPVETTAASASVFGEGHVDEGVTLLAHRLARRHEAALARPTVQRCSNQSTRSCSSSGNSSSGVSPAPAARTSIASVMPSTMRARLPLVLCEERRVGGHIAGCRPPTRGTLTETAEALRKTTALTSGCRRTRWPISTSGTAVSRPSACSTPSSPHGVLRGGSLAPIYSSVATWTAWACGWR